MKARKKQVTLKFTVAESEQVIETIIDGKLETTNTAKPGDIIIRGLKNEKYTVPAETFIKRYNDNGDGTATTKPVEIECIENNNDYMPFKASWGETMYPKKGDMLVIENGELSYCIDKEVFEKTYEIIK